MTSLQTSIKQVGAATAYYIPVANINNSVYVYREDTNAFSTAAFAAYATTPYGGYVSSLFHTGGALLKDMGKTIVSSSRTFRKIQLVVPVNASTFGVAGAEDNSAVSGYFTGYIEMGFEGTGAPAKVAKYGA